MSPFIYANSGMLNDMVQSVRKHAEISVNIITYEDKC